MIINSTSNEHDQELDSVLVGPIPVGVNKFEFRADPPDLSRIPNNEIIGVTVILLSCSYDDREFVRVGYYVNNEYTDEALQLEPPAKPIIEKVRRNILAEKPRVTRFAIKWYDSRTTIVTQATAALTSTGIPRRPPHLSSPPISPKPISMRTGTSTASKRRRRTRKRRLRLRAPLLLRAKMPPWPEQTKLLFQLQTTMLPRRPAAKISRTVKARMRKTRRQRRRAATIWRWTMLPLRTAIRVNPSSPPSKTQM
jgi:hypothetical protein